MVGWAAEDAMEDGTLARQLVLWKASASSQLEAIPPVEAGHILTGAPQPIRLGVMSSQISDLDSKDRSAVSGELGT